MTDFVRCCGYIATPQVLLGRFELLADQDERTLQSWHPPVLEFYEKSARSGHHCDDRPRPRGSRPAKNGPVSDGTALAIQSLVEECARQPSATVTAQIHARFRARGLRYARRLSRLQERLGALQRRRHYPPSPGRAGAQERQEKIGGMAQLRAQETRCAPRGEIFATLRIHGRAGAARGDPRKIA